jgi:hypothetical protein
MSHINGRDSSVNFPETDNRPDTRLDHRVAIEAINQHLSDHLA